MVAYTHTYNTIEPYIDCNRCAGIKWGGHGQKVEGGEDIHSMVYVY